MIVSGRPTTGRPKKFSYREGRNRGLYIRLSESDMRKLEALCKFFGMTKTDYILMQIDLGIDSMRRISEQNERVKSVSNI